MTAPAHAAGSDREAVLGAMAEVMDRQARVNRAEVALSVARRRLDESTVRLAEVAHARGEGMELPPLAVAAIHAAEGLPPVPEDRGTLRERIVATVEASPDEVFTPARLAPLVGSDNRDSIRNTLLVLAAKGKVDKVGLGRYRARKPEGGAS